MSANIQPIFPLTPVNEIATLITADTSLVTPVTNGVVIITGGENGTRIDGMKIRALGTNIDTVLRVFINDGIGVLAVNFALVHEVQLVASTAGTDDITGVDLSLLPFNYDNAGGGEITPFLASGQKLYVSIGTTVASGYAVSVFGGDY